MHVPEREQRVGQLHVVEAVAVRVEALLLTGVPEEPRSADQELGDRVPVQPTGEREILGERLAALLPTLADAARLESLRVHAGDRVGLVLDLIGDPPEQSGTDLAPSRRQDQALDVGAMRAVVERRLVDLVQEADRDQHEPGARVHLVLDQEVERRELDRHAAAFVVRGGQLGGRVLDSISVLNRIRSVNL